jgi:hypothetical protein
LLGAERQQGKRLGLVGRTFARPAQCRAEMEMAAQAEVAYRRLMADWWPLKKKQAGASATRGREGQSRAAVVHEGVQLPLQLT